MKIINSNLEKVQIDYDKDEYDIRSDINSASEELNTIIQKKLYDEVLKYISKLPAEIKSTINMDMSNIHVYGTDEIIEAYVQDYGDYYYYNPNNKTDFSSIDDIFNR